MTGSDPSHSAASTLTSQKLTLRFPAIKLTRREIRDPFLCVGALNLKSSSQHCCIEKKAVRTVGVVLSLNVFCLSSRRDEKRHPACNLEPGISVRNAASDRQLTAGTFHDPGYRPWTMMPTLRSDQRSCSSSDVRTLRPHRSSRYIFSHRSGHIRDAAAASCATC